MLAAKEFAKECNHWLSLGGVEKLVDRVIGVGGFSLLGSTLSYTAGRFLVFLRAKS